ncbi:MAG TPA: alkaline phosphatase D family protein [Prosthecobacter sp.]|nr:alkaline phosphatase D family protein [Prosthecobacter sp.]HRK14080.1 alkaline phosphatase D family protein [Prosthecobacter sp.]
MKLPSASSPIWSRRRFVRESAVFSATWPLACRALAVPAPATHQATGVRVGEATDHSAIVWVRLTENGERNNEGFVFPKKGKKAKPVPVNLPVKDIEGACPGMAGRLRLRYGLKVDLSDAVETEWVGVSAATDFIHHFHLANLKPGSTYHYVSETAGAEGEPAHRGFSGRFHTAPSPDSTTPVRFCVMTCQGYPDRDHADGHPIYPSMSALDPQFISMTGDLVYYDSNEPRATSPALARLHWERMFSLPRLVDCLRKTSTYWLKDDHDTLTNDSWPGQKAGELTFAEGQEIFHQQAPLGADSYRTFRWGRDLQIWFTDGRDFRSPNRMPDGPEKTIWGAKQKEWFKKTVAESDATWKVLISPTPLVGPDRKGKNDNHANSGFAHEGDEIRSWLRENVAGHFFVICGDRHWQYHSVHPETGVQEFSVGAASDSHAGGTPGYDAKMHRFHRVKGGFLCVDVRREARESSIVFQLRAVDGTVEYEAGFQRAVA